MDKEKWKNNERQIKSCLESKNSVCHNEDLVRFKKEQYNFKHIDTFKIFFCDSKKKICLLQMMDGEHITMQGEEQKNM